MPADGRWDLTLILLTWRIWWAANNASRLQIGFNSAFKGLMQVHTTKFHEKPSSWSRIVHTQTQRWKDVRRDITKLAVNFQNFFKKSPRTIINSERVNVWRGSYPSYVTAHGNTRVVVYHVWAITYSSYVQIPMYFRMCSRTLPLHITSQTAPKSSWMRWFAGSPV